MTIEKIRELRHAKPFEPFLIHLANGWSVKVPERYSMALSPTGTFIVVYEPDDSRHRIEMDLISDITFEKSAR